MHARQERLAPAPDGDWRLTTEERKLILLTHIYGVDIDTQAVEVTKLSLLLKVLEEEQDAQQMTFLEQERVLPDLAYNIRCGNSLIGPDYYEGQQLAMFDEEEMFRINALDWKEGFPRPMAAGGFDAVIGNPPWGASFSKQDLTYLCETFKVAPRASAVDSYALFIERALDCLKHGGLLGYITPDTFLRKDRLLQTRKFLLENTCIVELIETGPVFSKVRDTWCLVSSVRKAKPDANTMIQHRKISRFVVSAEERLSKFARNDWDAEGQVPQSVWQQHPTMIVGYLASEPAQCLIAKVETNSPLGQLSDRFRISRGEEGSKFALQEQPDGDLFMVVPADVDRYNVAEGLRISGKTLTSNKLESFYGHAKIWIIRIQKMRWKQRLVCGLDMRGNSAGMKTLQVIVSTTDDIEDLKYLMAVLSSSLMNFWCVNYLADDMNKSYLQRLPIRTVDLNDPNDSARYKRMMNLADQMLAFDEKLAQAKTPQAQHLLQQQIEITDHQIDQLVYELYGLTEEEIAIVEESQDA
jgi:predicted RNA methylase